MFIPFPNFVLVTNLVLGKELERERNSGVVPEKRNPFTSDIFGSLAFNFIFNVLVRSSNVWLD